MMMTSWMHGSGAYASLPKAAERRPDARLPVALNDWSPNALDPSPRATELVPVAVPPESALDFIPARSNLGIVIIIRSSDIILIVCLLLAFVSTRICI